MKVRYCRNRSAAAIGKCCVYCVGRTSLAVTRRAPVQTPLAAAAGSPARAVQVGDPVLFRSAKAGEIAERFSTYTLFRTVDGVATDVRTVRTYRGYGHTFF